jgi:cold shock CspA family protein
MLKPDYMPADAQPVTLFGKPGWFVSQESIDAQGMAQQWKRPAQDAWGMGKGGKGFGGAPKRPAMATAPVENPGLIPEEQIYTGTVKHNINPNTGYGFVQDDTVTMMYPGKDAFLHIKYCPWAADMGLNIGDSVMFNLLEDEQGNPQVKRIVKA